MSGCADHDLYCDLSQAPAGQVRGRLGSMETELVASEWPVGAIQVIIFPLHVVTPGAVSSVCFSEPVIQLWAKAEKINLKKKPWWAYSAWSRLKQLVNFRVSCRVEEWRRTASPEMMSASTNIRRNHYILMKPQGNWAKALVPRAEATLVMSWLMSWYSLIWLSRQHRMFELSHIFGKLLQTKRQSN